MTYTAEEVARHEARACPGCGHRVEQDWIRVEFDPDWADRPASEPTPDIPPEYVPGLWACRTPGCENGPPALPPGCICGVADITMMGFERRQYTIAGKPECTAHGRAE